MEAEEDDGVGEPRGHVRGPRRELVAEQEPPRPTAVRPVQEPWGEQKAVKSLLNQPCCLPAAKQSRSAHSRHRLVLSFNPSSGFASVSTLRSHTRLEGINYRHTHYSTSLMSCMIICEISLLQSSNDAYYVE